jgi:hypothetical protein
MSETPSTSVAEALIAEVFRERHEPGATQVPFTRDDIIDAAVRIGVARPKNIGGVIYQYRYMKPMPDSVAADAPADTEWVIRGRGSAKYAFEAVPHAWFTPSEDVPEILVPSATPRLIEQHALDDEQALLSTVRHASLVSLATGVVAHHLQSHVRSTIASGQVELDDLYVGIDDTGQQYSIPVEAKAGSGAISLIQVEQGAEFCLTKKPETVCLPLGIQRLADGTIHFFVFGKLRAATGGTPTLLLQRELRVRLT